MKILNWLLKIFIQIYEIFLYSLLFPLTLGIIWILGGVYDWFMDFSLIVKIPVCIVVGICLKIWRDNYLKSKQKIASINV